MFENKNNFELYFYKTSSGKKPIDEFIDNFDLKTQAKINIARNYLKQFGLATLQTHFAKKIHNKPSLYELRISAKIEIRMLFVKADDISFVILHAFVKKSQKTPSKEIKTALKRFSEYF